MVIKFSVYIKPNARQSQIIGWHDGHVKIAIASPPVDGKANKTLIEFLAKQFAVNKSQVQILQGSSARKKLITIEDSEFSLAQVMKKFC